MKNLKKVYHKNEYTWSNILRRYKGRPSNLNYLNLQKFVTFHFYKDQVIHPQFFGYNKVVNFPPTENYSKIMLTIYKPWNNCIEETLDLFASCQNCNEVCKYRRNRFWNN